MRLNQLDQFVAAVEAGSLRGAARALGTTHPALTKSLQALENEVGTALLHRTSRGVVCTHAGRALLARARVVRAEVQKAELELAQWSDPHGGAVGVGLAPPGTSLAVEVISRFVLANPHVRLRVMESASALLVPLVRDETLDFAVIVKMPKTAGAGLRFRTLASGRMVVACRRAHPLRRARSLAELADALWLGLNAPGSGGWLEQTLAARGLSFPRRYVQCESFTFAFDLMARTDAVIAVGAPVLAAAAQRGALEEIALEQALPAYELGLCTRADARLTPLAARLARAFVAVAQARD